MRTNYSVTGCDHPSYQTLAGTLVGMEFIPSKRKSPLDAFVASTVKGTEFGPPPPEGIDALKRGLRFLTPSLLKGSQNLGVNSYFLEEGQDPVTAGLRHPFDTGAFPTISLRNSIPRLLANLKRIEMEFSSDAAAYSQAFERAFLPYHSTLTYVRNFPGLFRGFFRFDMKKTLGEIAAARVGSADGPDYYRFIRQIRDCNPHLFPAFHSVNLVSLSADDLPLFSTVLLPPYKVEKTHLGHTIPVLCSEAWESQYLWKSCVSDALGGPLAELDPSRTPMSIYYRSPVRSPKDDPEHSTPAHELAHLWDFQLQKKDPAFHAQLYAAARETVRKGQGNSSASKLLLILRDHTLWNTQIGTHRRPHYHEEELLARTSGFVFQSPPEKGFHALDVCEPTWKKPFRSFIQWVESQAA